MGRVPRMSSVPGGGNKSGINFGIIWQIDLKATKVI